MSAKSSNPADWTLAETVLATTGGDISAVEVAEATLRRIELRQPILNCYIRVDEEAALSMARAADGKRARGEALGPLHGAALAHKDMYYRAGMTVTCGSAVRRNFVPDITATVMERVDAAGATYLGGLNMSEFASGPTGHNVHWGDCHNPWKAEHLTGGSSSGSGSAVGGRVAHASIGSDTGGSIRLPAGICGVYGIKATQGRVSRYGAMGLSFSLDNVGPLARTARDCARMLSVIAGPDPMDTTTVPVPAEDYEADLDLGVKGLTIGVPENHYFDDIDPEIGEALDDVLRTYEALGATIRRVTLPHHDLIASFAAVVSPVEQCTLHEHWLQTCPELYSPLVRARMKAGFAFSGVEYLKAMHMRGPIASAVAAAFGADVLFTPILRFPVPTLAETDVKDGDNLHSALSRITHCTRPVNYLGFPALSVPAGFSASGLPIGFQLIGRPLAEKLLFRVGAAFERERGVPDLAPQLP